MMSESNLILLLQLIKDNADAGSLIERGLRYQQIGELINRALKENFIEHGKKDLALTEKGIEKIRHGRPDGGFISPEQQSRIKSISINKIFLPKDKNSIFEIREAD